jgi:xanthine dehydrogenase molybdenum-binding subunit
VSALDQNLKYIGKYIPIHDAKEKVSGKVRYVGDMEFHGMLYAKLVLSSIAHGIIKYIDTSDAEALPGVVGIFSYKNSPEYLYNTHKWIDGMEVIRDERLFTNQVRFFGDRIAAVVAESKEIAEKAANLIVVEYEELPVILDPEIARKEDSYPIHPQGNHIYTKEIICGNPDGKMKDGFLTIEDRIETPKIHHAAMETHACIADTDHLGNITVYTPCQVIFQVQLIISEALKIPRNKIRVIKTTIGGSFGGKGQPILEPIVGFLSYTLKRPIKLVLDRTEDIIATRTRTKTIGTVKTAVDNEGNIIARDIHMLVDAGAYCTNGEAIAVAMGKKAFKLYRLYNQRYLADVVYTNTPIAGACRGYGSPQIHAVTEINLDNAARALHMDPVDFRLKNLVHPYDKDPTGGPELGNARIIDCVNKGREVFDWDKRYSQPKKAGRYVRGVGMACAAHGNGYFGAYPDFITLSLRLNEEGTAVLKGAFHDLGCGTNMTMMQIVAEVLEIDVHKVYIPDTDTSISPFDSAGTQASRVTFVCGGAAKKVAEQVKAKLIAYGGKILNCMEEDVVLKDGYAWDCNNTHAKISYGELVTLVQKKYSEEISATMTYQSPGNPTSYGAHFVEVEVDNITGRVKILDYLAVHDLGKAINSGFVEGQIQGAVQMGIGMALSEEITFDSKGKVTSGRFSRYHVINAPDMPEVRVELIEELEDLGPFGAKSIGEIAVVPTAPAIINAINHALGINLTILPALPDRIMEAIKNKIEGRVYHE